MLIKGKQIVSKGCMLCDQLYDSLSKAKTSDEEQISGRQRLEVGGGITTKGEHEEVWRVAELFCILILAVVIQVYTRVKIHTTL